MPTIDRWIIRNFLRMLKTRPLHAAHFAMRMNMAVFMW